MTNGVFAIPVIRTKITIHMFGKYSTTEGKYNCPRENKKVHLSPS